jgi:hypothetical protein
MQVDVSWHELAQANAGKFSSISALYKPSEALPLLG